MTVRPLVESGCSLLQEPYPRIPTLPRRLLTGVFHACFNTDTHKLLTCSQNAVSTGTALAYEMFSLCRSSVYIFKLYCTVFLGGAGRFHKPLRTHSRNTQDLVINLLSATCVPAFIIGNNHSTL